MGLCQMFEEVDVQFGVFGGIFDQVGNVGDYEVFVVIDVDYVEVWYQGGEWIVGYFWFGCGYCVDESVFVGIWQFQQVDVGQYFQFQFEVVCFVWFVWSGLVWCLIGIGFEMGVIEVMLVVLCDYQLLIRFGQVVDDFLGIGVDYGGIDWYWQDQVVVFGFGVVFVVVVFVVLGIEMVGVVIVDQGVQVDVGFQIDGIVVVIVVVVGIVFFDEFFVMKVYEVIVVVIGFYVD